MEGDVEGAQRLAKRMGIPFKDALAAYVEVNRLNAPSFEGGALIAKTGDAKVKKSVVTSVADQETTVRQNNCAGSSNPQLEIIQDGISVFLTKQNCADLAAQLNTIRVT